MIAALSAAGGWVVAVAIALPIVLLFWWARRNAPVGQYEVDYSVGRRDRAAAPTLSAPVPPMHGVVDAPVPANPAALAPPAESATPPAATVNLPEHAPLPPEPASVMTPAPVAAAPAVPSPAEPVTLPAPKPVPPPVVAKPAPPPPPPPPPPAPKPVVAKPAPTPVAAKPKPAPVVAKAPEPEPEKPAAAPEPTPAPAAAAAEPSGEPDDFSRLYGPNAASIDALHAAGIITYRQLSAASIQSLKDILEAAGQSSLDPSTWPQQGRFAAGGKWKQLDARFKG